MNGISNTRADMKAGLFKCVESGLHRIENLWEAIGFTEEQRCERMKVVFQQTQDLYNAMCEEEETLKSELKHKIDQYRDEAMVLFNELGMEADLPERGSMVLVDMEESIRKRLDDLDKEKYRRIKSYKHLKEAEESLCETLGLETGEEMAATPPGIPHNTFLNQLRDRVEKLEQERERRVAAYCSVQESILQLWRDLDKEPQTDFEISIAARDADTFLLSEDNLSRVSSLCKELRKEFDNLEHTAAALRDQVVSMWQRLDVPQEERVVFSKSNEGCKPAAIKQWRKELERLEELKRQNMRLFVEATREELKKQWDACMYGLEQRREFAMMDTDEYDDNVLEAHEREVQRLKQLYNSNAQIYKAIEKRQAMWARYLELERGASDPDKFKNRGGKLLREQNEKKLLSKELPKLEKELKSVILSWENDNQRYFLVYDNRFLDVVTSDWKQLRAGREQEKKERQKQKEIQMAEETIYGSKPATPLKRKATATPVSLGPASKMSKLAHGSTPSLVHSSLRSPQVRVKRAAAVAATVRMSGPRTPKKGRKGAAGLTVKRKILAEQNYNETIQKCAKGDASLASHGSYTDFTHALNRPDAALLRSSIINNH